MMSRRRTALLPLFASFALLSCGQPPGGECAVDGECDDAEPCTLDVCDQGTCVNNPDDTLVPPQGAPIDCKREVCQDGRTVQIADDTETPNDNVACTQDTCVGGTPSFAPQDNLCGAAPDCNTLVCDPNGLQGTPDADGCSAVPDDLNVPDDGAACTTDSCQNGTPVFVPDDGVCGGDATQCEFDLCDPPNQNTDDGSGCFIQDPATACDDGLGCTSDDCAVGTGCVSAPDSGLCQAGEACDPAQDPGQNPTGCVVADVCPPVLASVPNGTTSGDTTGFLDDFALSCADNGAGHPDLAFSLSLAADSDVIVLAESTDGHEISVALVEISAGVCGGELLCDATLGLDAEIGVLNLAAGEYAIVVDGNGAGIEEGTFDLSILVADTILAAGDLVINEFHPNPNAVADGDGEFLELANPTALAISTAGVTASENGGATVLPIEAIGGGQLIIPAGGFAVGVANTDPLANGGIDADFELLFSLNNTPAESFQIAKGALVLDAIDAVGGGFPTATAGASFQLDLQSKDAALNDTFATWCVTPTATYGAGDLGTPGLENEACLVLAVCGNNIVEAGETCDDGNTTPGDGCDANCQIEQGAVCGNGLIEAGEACDDANTGAGDGCDAACQVEPGFSCAGEPSVCVNNGGDCAAAAPVNAGDTILDDTTGQADNFQGSCTGTGAGEDLFTFTTAAAGTLSLTLTSDADMGLYVRLVCEDDLSELDCTDINLGPAAVEILDVDLLANDAVTIFVDGFAAGEEGLYTLDVAFVPAGAVCGNGIVEAGETCDDGNTTPGDGCDANCQIEGGGAAVLIVNEVDYDQDGGDTASFIEILNTGTAAADLNDFAVVTVNGNGELQNNRFDLSAAGATLAPGQYLVIGMTGVVVAGGALFIDVGATDPLQNGAPDGVALFQISTSLLVDALSYEGSITNATTDFGTGFNLVAGTPTAASDSDNNGETLSRVPDGSDTNNDVVDWVLSTTPTPGAPNL